VADADFVMIDLELASIEEAEALLAKMRRIWDGSGSSVMFHPEARIVETVETVKTVEVASDRTQL
jgi:hypothetical protein